MTARGRRRSPALLPAFGAALLLAACGTPPSGSGTGHVAESRYQPGRPSYRVGSPYQVNGIWYYPKVDYDYDRTGTASWYGPQFDHRLTANGEIFDMNEPSAAHKTLPLPSVVRVTNLANGRALDLRVNDRGPFVGDRIIDVSRRAAQLLGFEGRGTTQVRVTILKQESIQVAEAAMRGQTGPVMLAAAPTVAPRRTVAEAEPSAAAPPTAAPEAVPPPAAAPVETPPPRLAAVAPSMPVAEPPTRVAVAPPAAAEPEPARLAATSPAPVEDAPAPAAAAPPRRSIASRIEAALIPRAEAAPLERIPPRSTAAFDRMIAQLATDRTTARIFVQAGAFSLKNNAERARERIARLGAAEVTSAAVNGAALYRVRLGPLSSVEEADRMMRRIVDSGYAGARIVRN